MNPVTMTLFGMLLLHENITRRKIAGIICAISGVYVILGGNIADTKLSGILLSLFSVVVWSFVSVLVRKVTAQYHPLFITRLATGIAALCYLPVAMIECSLTQTNIFPVLLHDSSCFVSLIYMGVVCTGIAYMLWNKSLSVLETNICSSFYPIQPLVSTLLGMLFLGEKITPQFFIGAFLIAAGVFLN